MCPAFLLRNPQTCRILHKFYKKICNFSVGLASIRSERIVFFVKHRTYLKAFSATPFMAGLPGPAIFVSQTLFAEFREISEKDCNFSVCGTSIKVG